MADTFDEERARTKHEGILRSVQRIRDGISDDVIEYYYSHYPQSREEESSNREGMRKYLRLAKERINDLLDGDLE